MKKIFVTADLPGESLNRLRSRYTVEVFPSRKTPAKQQLIQGADDASALITMVTDQIDSEVIDSSQKLRVISNCGVGFENIDIEYASGKGIYVTNTPGVLTEATADLAWTLLMSVARRVIEGDRLVRNGEFINWEPTLLLGQNIYHKTLGIYGMGRIGTAVARRASGFGMNVIYHNRKRNESGEEETGAIYVDFLSLLRDSDFIVITAPLNEETQARFGINEFRQMRNSSVIVNVGRGKIIKEAELAQALTQKEIWGAGLDVYENEPEVCEKLVKLDNTVLLPHLGSASFETRCRMAEMAVSSVEAALEGKKPENVVNRNMIL